MHSHNDELNRLLDSLALGTGPETFDLDRETIETSSRFMHANHPMPAPADFVSHLEDSLMKRAVMTPVAISGRIEHIGEGIGLVAARPLPRRIRFERIAVLAAVVLLLLAAGGFYRSDSEKGGNWLLAPVASASPASNVAQDCTDPSAETIAEVQNAKYQSLFGWGLTRNVLDIPSQYFSILPESMLPNGPSPNAETIAAIEPLVVADWSCWSPATVYDLDITDIAVISMFQLDDGRVGALLSMKVNGTPIDGVTIYAPVSSGWIAWESAFALSDAELTATTYLNPGTIWKTQTYEMEFATGQQSQLTVREMRVPAGQPVELTIENIGTTDQQFTISDPGSNVDVTVKPGEAKTVTVTFAPGWHLFSTVGNGDSDIPAFGYIFAVEPGTSTPVAEIAGNFTDADCPSGDEYMATVEANRNENFSGLQFPATMNIDEMMYQGEVYGAPIYVQPAPNDPSSRIQVIALSTVPKGEPASAEVTTAIENLLPLDLFCFAPRPAPLTFSPTSITRMFMLPDGNVGILLSPDPGGFGLQLLTVYAPGSQQWVISSMMFVLPDADFVAPPNLPIEPSVLLEAWNAVQVGVDTTSAWPDAVQVPAETDVTITAKNVGSLPVNFSIPGTTVSVDLGIGESSDIVVNLSPGVYNYRFAGTSSDAGADIGLIFVADVQAPPTAATPAASGSVYCLPQDAWFATATANGIRTDYAQAITNPTQITAPNVSDEKIWAVAESQLPGAATVSPDVLESVESALNLDLSCAIEARGGRENYDPQVLSTTQLADGRVGVLIDQDLVGLGVEQYLIYAPGTPEWLLYEIAYVVPDEELLANVSGPIQTSINIDLWTTQATDTQYQSCSPEKARVAAGQPIDLTIRNLSLLPLTLSIPGASVEESIAAGATSTISVTFEPGVYLFSSSNAADTIAGSACVIFATEPSETVATPTS
jgi:hypothetical protein